jgi:hypothetical protein
MMKRTMPLCVVLGLLAMVVGNLASMPSLALADEARKADYYVATDGSDENPGTRQQPFASLSRARDAVRLLVQQGLAKDVLVFVRGGRYQLSETIVLGDKDSGSDAHSIIYAAFPGEQPVFSGGQRLRDWQQGSGEAWSTELPSASTNSPPLRQMFVGDERCPPVRHPAEGYLQVVAAGPDGATSFQFTDGDLGSFAATADARLVFLHDWSISRVGIQSIDSATSTVTLSQRIGAGGHGFFRITGFEAHPRYYVENATEKLNTPGQWQYNHAKRQVSYVPPEDQHLADVDVVAPVLEQLLILHGGTGRGDAAAGEVIKNVRFDGLTFAHAAAPQLPGGYAGIQAGFHEARSPDGEPRGRERMLAAVVFENAVRCRLENCRVVHVGGSGVSLQSGSTDCEIVGNEVSDVGGNGIMIGDTSTSLDLLARDNLVANNHIHRCGVLFHGCVGVWAGITEATVIAHNEIHDLPYTGVSIGWKWDTSPTPCGSNIVEYNHIHHVMQTLSDGGGIYTLGRQPGTVLRGNVIHNVPLNNGRAESNGMFIDEGSSEILIEGNMIYGIQRSPIRFHKAEGDTIRGNVLVSDSTTSTFRYNATDPATMSFADNTTPDSLTWTPPALAETGAGLQPPHRERLLRD